jgi:hypothetical protein
VPKIHNINKISTFFWVVSTRDTSLCVSYSLRRLMGRDHSEELGVNGGYY